jgi:hypothetical protein
MALPQRTPEQAAGAALGWRRLVLLLVATAAGGTIALIFLSQSAVRGPWLFRPFVAALLVAATGGLTWWIWRCPQCGGHLGTKMFVKQCPQCGTKLRSCGGGAA